MGPVGACARGLLALLLGLGLLTGACGPKAEAPTPSPPPAATSQDTSALPPVPLANLPLQPDESETPVPGGQGDRQLLSYLFPGRDAASRPGEVVRTLGVEAGDVVADVGAGSGYFTVHLARAVAPGGLVLALDQDPHAVWFLRRRLAGDPELEALPIEVRRVGSSRSGLAPGSVDLVFLSEVHVFLEKDPWVAEWLQDLRRALRPGGRLAVMEHHVRPDGRPVTRQDMVESFRRAGFELLREHDVVPDEHLMEFR